MSDISGDAAQSYCEKMNVVSLSGNLVWCSGLRAFLARLSPSCRSGPLRMPPSNQSSVLASRTGANAIQNQVLPLHVDIASQINLTAHQISGCCLCFMYWPSCLRLIFMGDISDDAELSRHSLFGTAPILLEHCQHLF